MHDMHQYVNANMAISYFLTPVTESDYMNTLISKLVGIFHKLRYVFPQRIIVDLYYTMVYPYLIYCKVIWGGA